MLKIGITGGIGSGKTTICKIFATLGVPIYYADTRAKMIMTEDKHLIRQVKEIFGEEAYLSDGQLNRPHIAGIAFNDKEKLAQLNGAVHPALGQDMLHWQNAQKEVAYTLQEAAIMFESGSYRLMDKVITVYADQDLRMERVLSRDKATREEVLARMTKQMPEEEKIKMADFVIYNNGKESLVKQVLEIHRKLVVLNEERLV